jgi:hypothetical protein
MMNHTDGPGLETMAGSSETGMTDIVRRLNAIGDNPLCRNEVVALRRAYTAAVVRYFDHRRMVAGEDPA